MKERVIIHASFYLAGLNLYLRSQNLQTEKALACIVHLSLPLYLLLYRGTNMSAHVLLNLLYELGKKLSNARLAKHFNVFSN